MHAYIPSVTLDDMYMHVAIYMAVYFPHMVVVCAPVWACRQAVERFPSLFGTDYENFERIKAS